MKWSESCSVVSDCDPKGCTRILEQVAFPFSRGSSQSRDQSQVSHIAGRFSIIWATREAQEYWSGYPLSSGSSWPRNWTGISCTAGRFFTIWATRDAQEYWSGYPLSSGSSRPRNWTGVSSTAGRFFTNWAIREAQVLVSCGLILNSPTNMWLKFPKKRGSQTENNILRNNDHNTSLWKTI